MKRITEPELAQATEMMAEVVHNYWMEKRKKEKGWHAPGADECPYKQVAILTGNKFYSCPNCHPCMLPYKDLPDSEKELDRLYPTVFLSILKDMGFLVARP